MKEGHIYSNLLSSYRNWLHILGYAPSTVYKLSQHLKEFLLWLIQGEKTRIEELCWEDIKTFMSYYQNRPNKRLSGGLSIVHINTQIESIKKLLSYLKHQEGLYIENKLSLLVQTDLVERAILSPEEIGHLYEVCANTILGLRDKAMLGIYYGCGLRRSEGVLLDLEDLNYDGKVLKVNKSKTGRQRYVPIAGQVMEDLQNYTYESRSLLVTGREEKAFFVSSKGSRIQGQGLYLRLKALLKEARIEKRVALHSLRRSIATHLLDSGMPLEDIADFLGHRYIGSTQLYTNVECPSFTNHTNHTNHVNELSLSRTSWI